jgi:cyclopropane-fatty-acyl-phospholipid synthase
MRPPAPGSVPPSSAAQRLTPLERRWLRAALRAAGDPPIGLIAWTGEEVGPGGTRPRLRARLRERPALRDLLRGPDVLLGNAYVDGSLEIDGDLASVIETAFDAGASAPRWARWLAWLAGLRPLPNTLRRSRDNVHRHYDLGNDFYRLWLDERMVYTCAYFTRPEATLEDAQLAKMEHVCRKLRLRPGERVVEAGCGWGSLALHMAERHGVFVRAVNVSSEQIQFAREQARRRGLEQRVEFVEDDYRNIAGRYDAFVSVGMLEHVGRSQYKALGRVIERSLEPAGRGLLHFIGHRRPWPMNAWLERNVFPGAYIPALSEALRVLEPHPVAVVDVENLRRHYARTLEHWSERFEKASDAIAAMYDERFVRTWRLYLASSIAAFRNGSCQLYQILFARQRDTSLPWTRDWIYAE